MSVADLNWLDLLGALATGAVLAVVLIAAIFALQCALATAFERLIGIVRVVVSSLGSWIIPARKFRGSV